MARIIYSPARRWYNKETCRVRILEAYSKIEKDIEDNYKLDLENLKELTFWLSSLVFPYKLNEEASPFDTLVEVEHKKETVQEREWRIFEYRINTCKRIIEKRIASKASEFDAYDKDVFLNAYLNLGFFINKVFVNFFDQGLPNFEVTDQAFLNRFCTGFSRQNVEHILIAFIDLLLKQQEKFIKRWAIRFRAYQNVGLFSSKKIQFMNKLILDDFQVVKYSGLQNLNVHYDADNRKLQFSDSLIQEDMQLVIMLGGTYVDENYAQEEKEYIGYQPFHKSSSITFDSYMSAKSILQAKNKFEHALFFKMIKIDSSEKGIMSKKFKDLYKSETLNDVIKNEWWLIGEYSDKLFSTLGFSENDFYIMNLILKTGTVGDLLYYFDKYSSKKNRLDFGL